MRQLKITAIFAMMIITGLIYGVMALVCLPLYLIGKAAATILEEAEAIVESVVGTADNIIRQKPCAD